MRCERLRLSGDPAAFAAELRALIPASASVAAAVGEIIDRVRAGGDDAVLGYTRALDTRGADPRPLRVPDAVLDAAAAGLEPEVRRALEREIANVQAVAAAQTRRKAKLVGRGSHQIKLTWKPVARAGRRTRARS